MRKKNITNGTTYVMFAYAACVASGNAIHTGLTRLPGHSEYSIYAVAIFLIRMATLKLTTGLPQAVSRYVAIKRGKMGDMYITFQEDAI